MKLTSNYNLKKPEGTDIVNINDFNDNADIIDTQLKNASDHSGNKNNPHGVTKAQVGLTNVDNVKQASKAEFDAHLADYAAHGIGDKATLLTTQKFTIVGAINEVFQSGNNVKLAMVDKLLSVDPSLPINYESTWTEIETAAGQISTGKRWASGSTILGIGERLFLNGLLFVPKLIVWRADIVGGNNEWLGLYNGYDSSSDYGSMRIPSSSRVLVKKSDVIFDTNHVSLNTALASNVSWNIEWWAFE